MTDSASAASPLKFMQLALNSSDMVGTLHFYSDVFGFINAGSTAAWGPILEIQGLQNARTLLWWVIGKQELVQLELFHHTSPAQKPLPDDWSPSDIGWGRFGLSVPDFDLTLARLVAWNVPLIAGVRHRRGGRRAAIRDPYVGVVIEIVEEVATMPGGIRVGHFDADPAIIYVAMSVSDLDASRDFYANQLCFDILPLDVLHDADDEAVWGLPGAKREGFAVKAGDVFVEVLAYESPLPRPKAANWLISDQGIMNVAFGTRDTTVVQAVVDRLDAEGRGPRCMLEGPGILGTYILDAEREIEMFAWPPDFDAAIGFAPANDYIGAPRTEPPAIALRYR